MVLSSIPGRRAALLALASGLSVAAMIAIVAVLTKSFDRTDSQLIGTSLGFSIFSALGAAGGAARRRGGGVASLGTIAAAAAGLSFAVLMLAIWVNTTSVTWRSFGCLAVLTLATSHACLVISARRVTDTPLIANLAVVSVLTASLDALLAGIAISGAVEHIDSGYVRLAAVLVIVMLVSTALPPILRRAQETGARSPVTTSPPPLPADGHSAELLAVARRLEELVPHAGELAFSIEREVSRIRQLATTVLKR